MKKIFSKIYINTIFSILLSSLLLLSTSNELQAGDNLTIAVTGAMSGKNAASGKSIVQGAQLYIDKVNRSGGVKGKKIELVIYDDTNNADLAETRAKEIVKDDRALAVIGHHYSSCSKRGGAVYKKHGIPAITPTSTDVKVTIDNDWYFRTVYNDKIQGVFLANYAIQVLKEKRISIIHEDLAYGHQLANVFAEAVTKLGGEIVYSRGFVTKDKDLDNTVKSIIDELMAIEDRGVIFLAMHASEGVSFVRELKNAQNSNYIITPDSFASQIFTKGFADEKLEKENPGFYSNDVLVLTPIIFDTANEKAQDFRETYQLKYGSSPGWIAAFSYDSAMLLVEALRESEISGKLKKVKNDREKIRDYLANLRESFRAVNGVTGYNYFDENGDANKSIVIGRYQNNNIISSSIQLQGIHNIKQVFNYNEKIKQDKVITVNDSSHFITNIVYTGVRINQIEDLDMLNKTCRLDFNLWFRYKGNINPEKIIFNNAVGLVETGLPVSEMVAEGETYKLFKINGVFNLDFLKGNYGLGQHIAGLSFQHHDKDKNILIYVSDQIGMGISSGNEMLKKLRERKVLNSKYGWFINRAWFFQDIARISSMGTPEYLNIPGGEIKFSRFNFGIRIQKDQLTLRGVFSSIYAKYITWGSAFGLLLMFIFRKKRQLKKDPKISWTMFLFVSFLFLLGSEVLITDYVTGIGSLRYHNKFIMIYDILWWIVPAKIFNMAIEAFVWNPLEEKSGRVIPRIVRLLLSFVIYLLAGFGVIAYVYNQKLTSLMATSGMVAMIIGLAIKANLANVFSGIAINIERPFRIGDWIRIPNVEDGKVVDMTWRTTKIETRGKNVISIPNGRAADSIIVNFSMPDIITKTKVIICLDPAYDPFLVEKILIDAITATNGVLKNPGPISSYQGVDQGVARFSMLFCFEDYGKVKAIEKAVLKNAWQHLRQAGLTISVPNHRIELFKSLKNENTSSGMQTLSSTKIMKEFSDEAKIHFGDYMQSHIYNAGEIVVRQGDTSDSLFVIAEGVVGVLITLKDGEETEVARLGAGDFFGEAAMLTGTTRTASIIALTNSRLLEINREDFIPIMKRFPEVQEQFNDVLKQRSATIESGRKKKQEQHDKQHQKLELGFFGKIKRFFTTRKQTRIPVPEDMKLDVRINYSGGPSFSSPVGDLHNFGLSFKQNMEQPFKRGNRVHAEIIRPAEDGGEISIFGNISYRLEAKSSDDSDKYGIEFKKLSKLQKKKLINLMELLKES
jgi:potassium-dependent mechanosensitive channel